MECPRLVSDSTRATVAGVVRDGESGSTFADGAARSNGPLQRECRRSVRAVFACELGLSGRLAAALGLSLMSAVAEGQAGGARRCGRCIIPRSCSDLTLDGSSCARTVEGSADRPSRSVSTIPSSRSRRLNGSGKATASGGFLRCVEAREDGAVASPLFPLGTSGVVATRSGGIAVTFTRGSTVP
jgi:hypothetical protein